MNPQPDTNTLEGKIAVMQAFKDGKRVEWDYCTRYPHDWKEASAPSWNWNNYIFRIHPEDLNPPKLRPWKFGEVMPCIVVKCKGDDSIHILSAFYKDNSIRIGECRHSDLNELLLCYEHSTDGGKTWLPCGVKE